MISHFKSNKNEKKQQEKPVQKKPYRKGGKKLIKVLDKSVFDKNFDYGFE